MYNVLQLRLSFLQFYYFTFLASLMAFSVPWKCRDCKFVGISSPFSSLWLTCKMPKAQWDRDRNIDTIMEISVAHGQPLLIYSEKKQRKSILAHFVDWLFHALQTLVNQSISKYQISMISSNILPLRSFFSKHRPFTTLWFQLHYTLSP